VIETGCRVKAFPSVGGFFEYLPRGRKWTLNPLVDSSNLSGPTSF